VSRKSHSPRKGVEATSRKQSPGKKQADKSLKLPLPRGVQGVSKNSDGPIDIIFPPLGLSDIMDVDVSKVIEDENVRKSRSVSRTKEPRSRSNSKPASKKKGVKEIDHSDMEDPSDTEVRKQSMKYARKSIGNKL
jgi:hypothetical protein